MRKESRTVEINNKKAFHDYSVEDTYEAGIALVGTEVKSVKLGHAQIQDAFLRVGKNGTLILFNAQIDEYHYGNLANHDPKRQRYLLLHTREMRKIRNALEKDGYTGIALKMYIAHGLVKVRIGLGKGKKEYDKRHDLRKRAELREAERFLAGRHR
jgi:SsrA-binding protein